MGGGGNVPIYSVVGLGRGQTCELFSFISLFFVNFKCIAFLLVYRTLSLLLEV